MVFISQCYETQREFSSRREICLNSPEAEDISMAGLPVCLCVRVTGAGQRPLLCPLWLFAGTSAAAAIAAAT